MPQMTLNEALTLLLDQVDYTADPPNCRANEMVGAVLPMEVLMLCREAMSGPPPERLELIIWTIRRGIETGLNLRDALLISLVILTELNKQDPQ